MNIPISLLSLNGRIKKNIFLFILLGVAPSLLYGCGRAQVRRDIKMDMWIGHHYNEVIEELGPPTEIKTDASGDTVLVYKFLDDKIILNKKVVRDDEAAQQERVKPVMVCTFWINDRGRIIRWNRTGSAEKDTDIIPGSGYSNRGNRSNLITSIGVRNKF
jgi:hypothetical protein